MRAIRWTAKGLKLLGQLLEAKEVEEWLEEKGHEFIEEKLAKLPVKFLAGRWRAKRQISSNLCKSIEKSDAFRASLEASLKKLPQVVLNIAEHFRNEEPSSLVLKKGYSEYIVVCPRGLVREHYAKSVVNELKDSAELSRYEGLPERFLYKVARQSEDSFFSNIAEGNKEILPRNKDIIIAVDDSFGWNIEGVNGHYYVGGHDTYSTDLREKKQRKEFLKEMAIVAEDMKIKLGKLSSEDLMGIVKNLG